MFFFSIIIYLLSIPSAGGVAAPSASFGTFAWISDPHLDQLYGSPGAEVHESGAPCDLASAPRYSAYGCGGSRALIEAAFEAAANATKVLGWPELDFLLFTGDNTRHNSQNESVVLQNIAVVQSLFREYFPTTAIVELPALDLGNNDFTSNYYLDVTSHEPCLPSSDSNLPPATNKWLQIVAEEQSDMFATDLEKATFACGGYLNRAVTDKLHVIVLNTVVWSLYHSPKSTNVMDEEDPFGQFAWLETQLSDLQNAGLKAYITGHIPPMLQSYTGNPGQPLYKEESRLMLFDILTKYSDTVAGIFAAHVHSNELRHVSFLPDDSPPLLVSGSIAPCYTTNPTFSVVKYDRDETLRPLDMATFTVDLDGEILEDGTNPFGLTLPSVLEYLEMELLTNKEVMKLSNRMLPGSYKASATIWNRYFNHFYKGTQQTTCDTTTCQRAEACLVACGFESDSWHSCTAPTGNFSTAIARGVNEFSTETACNTNVLATSTEAPAPQPTDATLPPTPQLIEKDKSSGYTMWPFFATFLCTSYASYLVSGAIIA